MDAEAKTEAQTGLASSMTIAQGVLHLLNTHRQTTNYTFKNNATAPRALVVEHPSSQWRLVEPATPSEQTAQWYRFDVAVPAGASVGLTVLEEQKSGTGISLC